MAFKINHTIDVDFSTSTMTVLYMKQGDSGTREITVKFYNNGAVYAAPQDVNILQLAYCKADNIGGCYDHMPDSTVAGSFNQDRTAVTMQLHPQVLNVAGDVTCELRLLTNDGKILNAFNFIIYVQKSPIAMTTISEGYYNNVFDGATFTPHIDVNGILSWTNDKGLANPPDVNLGITSRSAVLYAEQELTDQQKAQARENIGAVSAEDLEAKQTFLPVTKRTGNDGDNYTATDEDSGTVLPVVSVANSAEQISAEGKGRQIVFIPYETNMTNSPTLQINGGEVIPIRVRAPKNQGSDKASPDATLPVPVGALMRGVPYTMTFCGKYWLVDSLIDLHPEAVTQETVGAMIAEAIGDTAGALAEMDDVIGGAQT